MATFIDRLKALYRKLPEPPSMNYKFRRPAHDLYGLLPPNGVLFDIGSKDARSRHSQARPDVKIVCVDIQPGHGVDLVADAHDLHMVADNSVDMVICANVLEHVRYPQRVVKEIHRILKPQGAVFIAIPFVFRFHADPDDFYRFSAHGIKILCEEFDCIDSGFTRGPASTMCDLLPQFFAIAFCFNSNKLYNLWVYLFKWLLFWIKYLDYFIGHYQMAIVIHTESFFLGRKKAQ